MTGALEFTDQEWRLLESAPMKAGLAVGDLSDPRRWLQELYAVFDTAEALESEVDSVLIRAVTERMLAREGDDFDLPADLPDNPAEARAYLIADCVQAVRTVAQKAPEEMEAFRRWLLTLARRAAEATKEGGFLGLGGERISPEEWAALHELEAALGVID
ncbi:hypothetical protein [Caldilinea sp.]|jgi:hypothetical protein|uniref:hypothetical protein n=1 Tax=Caldilinea sp. TaxID=2293560 RepID=UPI0026310963|nr:hypothetical protein [uncultured Caldilinea sp.]